MTASGLSANSERRDATGHPARKIAAHGQYNHLIVIRQPDPNIFSDEPGAKYLAGPASLWKSPIP
jgi:hypothetical protein